MFGPYRLDGLLGRGGMGEVHRAFDIRRNRAVALKLLPESLTFNKDFRARFRREAALAARLTEPHIIPIHDYGEIDNRLYLDMRLVDGIDLATLIAKDGVPSIERTLTIIEQVAIALDAAHHANLIHRDVKPSNILLTDVLPGQQDFCYLADFGLARPVTVSTPSRLTVTGDAVGTLEYMAPERFDTGPVDHRVDVYALACVLYECLTGRRPFSFADPAVLLNAHLNRPPPRPTDCNPELPVGLDDVIARGMAKNPDARYSTAEELAAAASAAVALPPPIGTVPPLSSAPEAQESGIPPVKRAESRAVPSLRPVPASPLAAQARDRVRWFVSIAALVTVAVIVGTLISTGRAKSIGERVLADHTGIIYALAAAELDGRPVVVSGGASTLTVWDLHTGQPVGQPLSGHNGRVNAVAVTALDGRPIAVSADSDNTLRVWDLHTGQQLSQVATGTGTLFAVAITDLGTRPVAVSAGDTSLKIWDLHTGQEIGQPISLGTSAVRAVATTHLDGRTIAIAGGYDTSLQIRVLPDGQNVGPILTGHTDAVYAVTTAQIDGRPVAISGGNDHTLRIWDLHTGERVGAPLTGHSNTVWGVATAKVNGQAVAVSASYDHTLRLWNLHDGKQIGQPFIGHADAVYAVATAELDGSPVALSAGADGTLRMWDLATRAET